MSSAFEPMGFFWELVTGEKGDGWLRQVVRSSDVPRYSKEFLAEERRAMGEAVYLREYECEFGDSSQGIFKRSKVEARLSDEIQPLFPKR